MQPRRRTTGNFCKLDPQMLAQFPFRMCNPPPAEGQLRSYGVTPMFEVRLDDVLNRKHLPPLGLKDFEEWLLYVERDCSTLYFLLWFREYEVQFRIWKASQGRQNVARTTTRSNKMTPLQASSRLCTFFSRAQRTFLTPHASYALPISPKLLTPFHTMDLSSLEPPDPIMLVTLQAEVRQKLEVSLRRFVEAQYSNVGGGRMLCGIIAGTTFTLIGAVFPLLWNILTGRSQLYRLSALPGLLLGLTIFLASFHGVCLGVYVFGDFRQLKKFEMARPDLSINLPLDQTRMTSTGLTLPSIQTHDAIGKQNISVLSVDRANSRPSSFLTSNCSGEGSTEDSPIHDEDIVGQIYVSPPYFEDDEDDDVQSQPHSDTLEKPSTPSPYGPSAAFIFPLRDPPLDDLQYMQDHPQELQPMTPFDFDALPPPRPQLPSLPALPPIPDPQNALEISSIRTCRRFSLRCMLGAVQSYCSGQNRPNLQSPMPTFDDGLATLDDKSSTYSSRLQKANAVPAFATPLVRILNPVIARAQYEIVARSALFALIASSILMGALLAIPVVRPR